LSIFGLILTKKYFFNFISF